MKFEEELLGKVKNFYNAEHTLSKVFDEFDVRLSRIYNQLSVFSDYGFECDYDDNKNKSKLVLGDRTLMFELFIDGEDSFIQVTGGEVNYEKLYDRIRMGSENIISDSFPAVDLDIYFDYYLKKSFEVLNLS